jgi:multidrug resistance efflux pump
MTMAGTQTTEDTAQTPTQTPAPTGDGADGQKTVAPPDPQYRLAPEQAKPEQRLQPAASPPKPHRPPRAAPVIVLVLVAAAVWWLWPAGWPLPWAEPEGPLAASGTLEADEVLVAFEISGRIVELVEEGQQVQANEVVAKLDDSLIQVQILQANTAALQQLQVQAERYQLRTPIAGIVTRVPMHTGEVVTPGQTVIAVADLTTLDLTAYVLERDLGEVQVGQPVTVSADPFPGRTFAGVVTSTNPRAEFTPRNVQTQADRLNLVFGVKIRVENPDMALKPGMPADVTFPQP